MLRYFPGFSLEGEGGKRGAGRGACEGKGGAALAHGI